MSTDKNNIKQAQDQSYWAIVKRQFYKNKMAVWSLVFIIVIFATGTLADFIANDKPIMCGYQGKTYFPIVNSYGVSMGISKWNREFANVDWHKLKFDWTIMPLIPIFVY